MKIAPTLRSWIPMLCVLTAAWGLLIWNINASWFGHHDANGVWISTAARHLNTYGLAEVGIVPAINIRPDLDGSFAYYTHHPPLIVWVSAFNIAVFGNHEAAVRFGSVASTMISIAALYVLVRRTGGVRAALTSTLVYVFVPMLLFFGRLPNHEAYALAEILLFAAVMIAWVGKPTRARWSMLAVLATLGVWTAWAAPFVIGFMAFGVFIVHPRRRTGIVGLGVVTVMALIALVVSYEMTVPGMINDLLNAFSARASTTTDFYQAESAVTFSAAEWVTRQAADVFAFMTPVVLIYGIGGAFFAARRLIGGGRALWIGMLAAGLFYVLLLRNAAYEHEFYKIYLLPPLAISAGAWMVDLWSRMPRSVLGRVMRMAVVPLAGLSLVWAAFLMIRLQNFTDPAALAIALAVRDHARVDDVVISNLPRVTTGILYYANTNIVSTPDIEQAADEISSAADHRGVLAVWCGGDSVPAAWQDLPVERDDYCAYVRLR